MIAPFYAALLALLYVFLSARVIKLRLKYQVGLGDGEHVLLARAIRVQANFSEYIPFALLLVWMYEAMQGASWLVHMFGVLLCAGRILHAYGVSQQKEVLLYRQGGMVMTFTVIVVCSLSIILSYLV
ncbi:Inner membrane protein YecN [Marinomonas aquimarina]|uniref:Inner membrane protein YecN n=1 Tax=Marinomonas aquimarina TaxID=295068 RepID=A0A1A8TSC9_9GAMM|nr:MAPEG family protein [Marinomonas aquimarina]SBS35888.1 Inner membrane protein YecN [Marinomonas aquimarina]